jgi:hypothetical protein
VENNVARNSGLGGAEVVIVRERPDGFTPPAGEADPYLGAASYLGRNFEFQERRPGTAHYLGRIHNFTYGATLSMGLSASSISGMKYSIPRLIGGVSVISSMRTRRFISSRCSTTTKKK